MTRPIRVCYLIDGLTRAGTETQLLALIRSLDRRRVQPSLVMLNGDDDLSRELTPQNCPVLSFGVRSLHSTDALRAGAKLARFWRRERIDLVQTYFLDSTYFGVPLARLSGVRRVVRVRNNLGHWLTPKHRALGRLMGRLVDATLTNCEPARTALLSAEGGSPRKVVVLENGVDDQRFSIIALPSHRPRRIGAVANLRPVKGIDVFVRAAGQLVRQYPDLEFHVAGEGEQRQRRGAGSPSGASPIGFICKGPSPISRKFLGITRSGGFAVACRGHVERALGSDGSRPANCRH